ncbi:MAG: hypothetical protein Q9208_002120 [Pyrenodesmia sp. 3 TL-2023]
MASSVASASRQTTMTGSQLELQLMQKKADRAIADAVAEAVADSNTEINSLRTKVAQLKQEKEALAEKLDMAEIEKSTLADEARTARSNVRAKEDQRVLMADHQIVSDCFQKLKDAEEAVHKSFLSMNKAELEHRFLTEEETASFNANIDRLGATLDEFESLLRERGIWQQPPAEEVASNIGVERVKHEPEEEEFGAGGDHDSDTTDSLEAMVRPGATDPAPYAETSRRRKVHSKRSQRSRAQHAPSVTATMRPKGKKTDKAAVADSLGPTQEPGDHGNKSLQREYVTPFGLPRSSGTTNPNPPAAAEALSPPDPRIGPPLPFGPRGRGRGIDGGRGPVRGRGSHMSLRGGSAGKRHPSPHAAPDQAEPKRQRGSS